MNYCITQKFESLISVSKLKSLNNHPNAVYGLDSELNIAYQNPAALKFSEDNSGNFVVNKESALGKHIFDLIPDVLAPVYKELFESAQNETESSLIAPQFEYECSSPELYRRFSMHIYSLANQGVLVVHSLLIEEPYIPLSAVKETKLNDEVSCVDKVGVVRQCANCRRIRNVHNEEQWVWVPKLIKDPHTITSHVICKPCRAHYYPRNKYLSNSQITQNVFNK
jgi:hypothetical protein